jgi:micrococcal nuclease
MGREATKFTKTLIKPGDMVRIEFDIQRRDRYGRLLNEEVVKAGYANLMTTPPNVKYEDRFLKGYKGAREDKRELWR